MVTSSIGGSQNRCHGYSFIIIQPILLGTLFRTTDMGDITVVDSRISRNGTWYV